MVAEETDCMSGNDRDLTEPLHLLEDAETGDRFVLFTTERGVELQLRFEGDEPWATRKQMAELFGVSVQNIDYHVKNLYRDNELVDPDRTTKDSLVMGISGQNYRAAVYSLDVVLAVGQRVNSKLGILFRRWARAIERQYLINGFVIDKPRLMAPKRNDRIDELLLEIEEIRASEANVWKRVLELVSKCSDYHAMGDQERSNFFATFQNTVHWAVTSTDAADIIIAHSNASLPNAGLTNFDGLRDGRLPRSDDMTVAKNYYGDDEIKRLRMITNLALDFLASQAEQGRLATVEQYTQKLRELVKLDGRPLRPSNFAGTTSKTAADRKARRELELYKQRVRLEREAEGERQLRTFLADAKKAIAQKPSSQTPSSQTPPSKKRRPEKK
jgi:hypothetical protein